METKQQLRRRIMQERESMEPETAAGNSRIICRKLAGFPWYRDMEAVFVYAAIRGEVDLMPFVQKAWGDGKKVFFPKVSGQRMDFYAVENEAQLMPGTFGVPEPAGEHPDCQDPLALGDKPVILVPGVAFSEKGARVGYGKGYYDRYLTQHPALLPIGIAYEMQMVSHLQTEGHDVFMAQIITEKREVNCNDKLREFM